MQAGIVQLVQHEPAEYSGPQRIQRDEQQCGRGIAQQKGERNMGEQNRARIVGPTQ